MKLLLTGLIPYTPEQILKLESLGYETILLADEKAELTFDPASIDAAVCTNLFLHHDIALFTNLKRIQLTMSGTDRAPVDEIRRRGIELYNARDVYSIPIAEWVVLKVLEIYKKSRVYYQQQENREWLGHANQYELFGKTATIVGYGSIGREVAKRLQPFGVRTIGVHRRSVDPKYLDDLVLIDQLDQALEQSDIVVLAVPISPDTRHLFDRERLHRIKPGAVLVNIARGPVIDEPDLVEALAEGHFMGVALDVFETEPLPPDSPLWKMENVIVTPHNSNASDGVLGRLYEVMLKNMAKPY